MKSYFNKTNSNKNTSGVYQTLKINKYNVFQYKTVLLFFNNKTKVI